MPATHPCLGAVPSGVLGLRGLEHKDVAVAQLRVLHCEAGGTGQPAPEGVGKGSGWGGAKASPRRWENPVGGVHRHLRVGASTPPPQRLLCQCRDGCREFGTWRLFGQ